MLIVQVSSFGDNGDAIHRVHAPGRALGSLAGITSIECPHHHRRMPELALAADVLVLHFTEDWELLALCRQRRDAGRITVFEANDNVDDLQPWNPQAKHWIGSSQRELFGQLLREVDGVQTTSVELEKLWLGQGARRVAVFANHLPELPPLPPPRDRPLTVGWGGSQGHLADLYSVAPILSTWLESRQEVRLALMCHELARSFFRLPATRYQFTPFGSLGNYQQFLDGIDIGVAPLLPTPYNRCRSDVKFLEYAAHGVIGIYPDQPPYATSVRHGQTGLLYRTEREMIDCLERLRTDVTLRFAIRHQAHDYVQSERMLKDRISQRLKWYRALKSGDPASLEFPADVGAAATSEEKYVRLEEEAPEQTLLQAVARPALEAIPLLEQLISRHDDYQHAQEAVASLLNGEGRPHEALRYLERTRPGWRAARIGAEIGRAWFLIGDVVRARSVLEEAIGRNPQSLTAWTYLLRLLGLHPSPDGPTWARSAEDLFPTYYPLALLGARTYPAAQQPEVLLRLVERHATSSRSELRLACLAAFRKPILQVAALVPDAALELLTRAVQVFPASASLASALGFILRQRGDVEGAHAQHARAEMLRRQAAVYQEEFPPSSGAPFYYWQFAEHIQGLASQKDDEDAI